MKAMVEPSQQRLRLRDKRRRLVWVKVAAGTAVVALSLTLVFYVAHLPSLTIASVDVSGTNLVSADAITTIVADDLAGSYLYLVPHANAVVAPVFRIQGDIARAFPPVASVSVSTKNWKTLAVAVTERQATAAWCAGIPRGEIANDSNVTTSSVSGPGDCYLMDQGGYVFATSTADSGGLLKFYGILAENPIGKTYIEGFSSLSTELSSIQASAHRTPSQVLVDNGGTDVSVAFVEGGVVRFVRTSDSQAMLANIASVFASQSFSGDAQFDYADFRFGDKVYVKFK